MTTLRGSLRPLRIELIGAAGVTALLLLAAGAVALRLLAYDIPTACFGIGSSEPACLSRQYDIAAYNAFAGSWVVPVAFIAAFLPAIVGVILGVALVAKELDQRTAGLAWSVDPSRRHWLLLRTIPLLVVIALLGIIGAQVVEAMFKLGSPGVDILAAEPFSYIPYAGFSPMAAGISAFAITAAVGALLGRLLPVLLVAGALVIFGFVLIQQGNEQLMSGDTLIAEYSQTGAGHVIDTMLRAPDGRIITWDEAYPTYANPETGELLPTVTQMARYVPVEILPQVAARYVLFHMLVGLMALTLCFAVVERRSP